MTTEEALKITRIARAAWPSQRWDEYTIDVWVGALGDQDFGQIREAIERLVKIQTFASISEILVEARDHQRNALREIRNQRVFGEIEASREQAERSRERARAAFLETRATFDQAIAAKAARTEQTQTEPQEQDA